MSRLAALRHRLAALVRGTRAQDDLDDEMRLHVALRREQLESQGLTPEAAKQAASRRFGNQLRLREASVDEWGWRWLEQFGQDLRFAARTLLKAPGFTVTIVLTLALATGATTAIFSVVNGVLLRPLPFADPDRLVQIYGRMFREDRGESDPVNGPVGVFELTEFESQSTTFEGFTAYDLSTKHLDGSSGPERLMSISADLDFFSLLGAQPEVGRTFEPGDPPDVVVLSGLLWRRRFAADPTIVGRSITLDGRPFTVIGVMPDAFQFPYSAASLLDGALPESRTDIWVPTQMPPGIPAGLARRGRVTARMKPGVSHDAAAAELRVIAGRVEEYLYSGNSSWHVGVRMVPLADEVIEPIRRSLWTLLAAVVLVLVAACANVANLLLARMTVRSGEIVTRAALGAGRLRMMRQFLAEGLLLSLIGGLIAVVVAYWGTDLLIHLGSSKIPRAHEIALDWQTLVFLSLVCLTTAVLFSLAPALQALRIDFQMAKESGRTTMGRPYARVRDGLVVTEVALAFILALGAALVMREVTHLQNVSSGVLTENILTLHLTPRAEARDYYAIEERVSQLPGVVAAGFTQLVPLQNWGWEAEFSIRGRVTEGRAVAGLRYVTPGYFRTLGIPVRQGRAFSLADEQGAPRVIVVNEALARRYFAGEDPVGRDLDRGTIVGVVGDVRQAALNRPAEPEIFYPAAQNVTMASDIGMSLIVRTDGPSEPFIDLIRGAVREINPGMAIFNVKAMEQVVADSLWELNLYRWLIGLFAGLVLTLSAIGLYGVMSYNVTARLREFALRLALGSDQARLSRLVFARGVKLATIGLAIGVVVSVQLVAALGALPIESRPDVLLIGAVSGLLIGIALAACAVPAMRVATVDPVVALRQD